MTEDFVVREALPEDAHGFVQDHESAWDEREGWVAD